MCRKAVNQSINQSFGIIFAREMYQVYEINDDWLIKLMLA